MTKEEVMAMAQSLLGDVQNLAVKAASLVSGINDIGKDPNPPTPTPTPPPPPPGQYGPDPAQKNYAIPAGAKTLAAGTDLGSLGAGIYALEAGEYPVPDKIKPGVNLYAVVAGKSVIKGKPGKQTLIDNANTFGIVIENGGVDEKDNKGSALLIGDNCEVRACVARLAVGAGFGIAGSNVKVIGCDAYDNGSAGICGKADNSLIAHNDCYRNNIKVKNGDGGVMGKFTRTNNSKFLNNKIHDGLMTGLWFDINNGPCEIRNNLIYNIDKIKQDYEGMGIKLEICCPGWEITDNKIYDNWGPCFSLSETKKINILRNVLGNGKGPEKAVMHLRQLTRDDEAQKADHPGDWHLGDILFDENEFLDGVGIVTKSGAGTPLTMKLLDSWNIKVGANNKGKLDIRIPKG